MAMGVRYDFRNLVNKNSSTNFNDRTVFAFQTVFYKSAYSYRCCPCAFEHKYFLYIGDDG